MRCDGLNSLIICSIKTYFDKICVILDSINENVEIIILPKSWLGLEGYLHLLIIFKLKDIGSFKI